MKFRALKKRSLVEMVQDQIVTHIITGGLKHGDLLPVEAQLAKNFQVGKSTIREALKGLSAEGIIEIIPRKGICVRETPDKEPEEGTIAVNLSLGHSHLPVLLEAHTALLASCAWTACRGRTIMDVQNLRQVLEKIDESISPLKSSNPVLKHHEEYERQYFTFYRFLGLATHNPLLIKLIEAMHTNLMRYLPLARVFFIRDIGEAEILLQLDRQLVDAIDGQNCGEALTFGIKKAQEIERIIKKSLEL